MQDTQLKPDAELHIQLYSDDDGDRLNIGVQSRNIEDIGLMLMGFMAESSDFRNMVKAAVMTLDRNPEATKNLITRREYVTGHGSRDIRQPKEEQL